MPEDDFQDAARRDRSHRLKDLWPLALVGLAAVIALVALVAFPRWKEAVTDARRRQDAEPFRIAGNLYYVGGSDATAFLLTGPEGHVLIDGGYPETATMIIGSISRLGFDVKDVRILLNTEPHLDHAGGLAELQKVSGARLWVSERDAPVVSAGGAGGRTGPLGFLTFLPIVQFPAPRVDRRFKDGETIGLGPIALTAHVMPTCTAWSFRVHDADRDLDVVHLCDVTPPSTIGRIDRATYADARADFERSFRTLRSLPADIWVTTHARAWGRYRKFQESRAAKDPVAPFIDPDGYRRSVDAAETAFHHLVGDDRQP